MTLATALKLSDFYQDNKISKTNDQTIAMQDLIKNFGIGDSSKGENFFAGIKSKHTLISAEELNKILQGELSDQYDVEIIEM